MKTKTTFWKVAVFALTFFFTNNFFSQTHFFQDAVVTGSIFQNGASEVSNPLSDSVNSSSTVIQTTGGNSFQETQFHTFSYTIQTGDKFFISFYNPNGATNWQLRMDLSTTGTFTQISGADPAHDAGSSSGWTEVSLDLSAYVGEDITKIHIYAAAGQSVVTNYDNIYIHTESVFSVAPSATYFFQDAVVTGSIFQNGASEVSNPLSDSVNSSSTVIQTTGGSSFQETQFHTFSYTIQTGDKFFISFYNPNGATNWQLRMDLSTTGTFTQISGADPAHDAGSSSGWTEVSLDLSAYVGEDITKIHIYAAAGQSVVTNYDNIYIHTESVFNNKWTGTSSNVWNLGANWSKGTVPTSAEILLIPASASVDPVISSSTGAVGKDLTVEAGASLNIASGGSLILQGTSSGNITYSRTLTANIDPTKSWHLLSSPVSGENVQDFIANNTLASGTTNTNFRGIANYKIGGSNWNYYLSTYSGSDAFDSGKGYSVKIASAGDISFIGTYTGGDKEYSINQTTNNFNLVGNPYAAYINLGTFFTSNNVTNRLSEQTIWLWNPDEFGTGLGGYVQKMSGTDANFEIAPSQGFFVSSGSASSNKVTFNESNQSHKSNTFLKISRTEVHLNISQDNIKHSTKIYYIDGTTTGFDNGFDGSLFGGINYDLAVSTQLVANNQGINLGIQSLPNNDFETLVIPINVKAKAGKEIIFSANALNVPNGLKVYLEDRVANTFNNLSEANSVYKVNLTDNINGIGRFYIHTKQSSLSVPVSLLEDISVYKLNKSTLRISGLNQGNTNIKLFNILGKQVINSTFNSKGIQNISLPKLRAGVYIIQLITAEGKINKKIILE